MNDLYNWKFVKSKSDKHPVFGYPMGAVLCRNLEEANEYIKNSEFVDCYSEFVDCYIVEKEKSL